MNKYRVSGSILIAVFALSACAPSLPKGAQVNAFGALLVGPSSTGKTLCTNYEVGPTTTRLSWLVDKSNQVYDAWCVEYQFDQDWHRTAAVTVIRVTPETDSTKNWLPLTDPILDKDCSQ